MCGRYCLTHAREAVAAVFGELDITPFPPRYNIAPTEPVLVIAAGPAHPGANRPARRALLARWGLWPAWLKDPREFPLLFNARSESAAEKASFRAAMRHRRVLVPASGFYEWRRPPKGRKGRAQAYWIRPRSGGLVAFGGLLETWASADGTEVDTMAILTTPANPTFSAIHERMPLVIRPEHFDRWLDCNGHEPHQVQSLLAPAEDDAFEAIPVGEGINKVANRGPDVQHPVSPASATSPAQETTPAQGRLL